jgi:hypothetical protein
MEQKQKEFISKCEFTRYYAEEENCIMNHFILPIKSCNFKDYLNDTTIEPSYQGKKNAIPKTIPLYLRTQVWDKHVGLDNGKTICPVCNVRTLEQISFHCGHVIAASKGGQNTVENLRPICQPCNSSMGTKDMNDVIQANRVS